MNLEELKQQDPYTFYEVFECNCYHSNFIDRNILDLGSNRGFFTIYAKTYGANIVVAVEPIPNLYNKMTLNCKEYENVIKINMAVHDTNTILNFIENDTCSKSDINGTIEVKTITLKDLLVAFPTDDNNLFMKMDIEGAEFNVINKVEREVIRRFSNIIIEIHTKDNPKELLIDKMKEFGFDATCLGGMFATDAEGKVIDLPYSNWRFNRT